MEQYLNAAEEIKTVENTVKENSIVWIKNSNNIHTNCARVISVDRENKRCNIFNFDEWSVWTVDFDRILRVDVFYYTDEYRNR